MRYHRRQPEIINAEYRVVSTRATRPAIGFPTCLALVTIAVLVRFFWPALLLLFILAGVTEHRDMAAVVIGGVILLAAWLRARLSGRPF
jgi:hypothetical protein